MNQTPKRHRLRYADVASTVAVVFAMSGTAVAASSLAANSVGTKQLKDGAVKTAKLGDNAVKPAKISNGAVTNGAIAVGAVNSSSVGDESLTAADVAPNAIGNSELAGNAVTGAKVATDSLTLADISGANVTGAISFSLGAGSCGDLSLTIPGAQLGQAVVLSFTAAPPVGLSNSAAWVSSAGHIDSIFCNNTASSMSASGLGVRIITFD